MILRQRMALYDRDCSRWQEQTMLNDLRLSWVFHMRPNGGVIPTKSNVYHKSKSQFMKCHTFTNFFDCGWDRTERTESKNNQSENSLADFLEDSCWRIMVHKPLYNTRWKMTVLYGSLIWLIIKTFCSTIETSIYTFINTWWNLYNVYAFMSRHWKLIQNLLQRRWTFNKKYFLIGLNWLKIDLKLT